MARLKRSPKKCPDDCDEFIVHVWCSAEKEAMFNGDNPVGMEKWQDNLVTKNSKPCKELCGTKIVFS